MNNSSNTSPAVSLLAAAGQDQPPGSHGHIATHDSGNDLARRMKVPPQSNQPCRYFPTKKGCWAGDQCRFSHAQAGSVANLSQSGNSPQETDPRLAGPAFATGREASASVQPPQRPPQRRPIPQAELDNPREFQINQVVRRYSPFRAEHANTTTLKFKLNPTDPDFPFELENLECVLGIPSTYPKDGRPTLQVQNAEMPRGFQINIEKGFDGLVTQRPNATLLNLLKELDKNLESFLTAEKAATFTFVANRALKSNQNEQPAQKPAQQVIDTPFIPIWHRYTSEQLNEARSQRQTQVRQLEARLGRLPLFSKTADGNTFNVPLAIGETAPLPASLRALKETTLVVPDVYPLEPCTIILGGVQGEDAETVEVNFENHASARRDLTLMAHMNYLSQNIAKLAIDMTPKLEPVVVADEKINADNNQVVDSTKQLQDPERPHIRYVNKPPEWSTSTTQDPSDTDETSETESESDAEIEDPAGGAPIESHATISGKGTSLSLPGLSLTNIELVRISKLSFTVKCDRCKTLLDIKALTTNIDSAKQVSRSEICSKCSTQLITSFSADLMHPTSVKAGTFHLQSCTITDLLPSTFQPTCSSCSTTFEGTTAVVGDTKLELCRSCHTKMSFTIPEIKFLTTSSAQVNARPLRRQKPKERLGISSGTPLPNNGRCQHYSKSYRWFRFSCCSRVFPCDKCHDLPAINPEQKDNPHPNEHADRMICGFCSREQRYHPETCRFCGHSVIKKSVTTGFWEGGKGTREKHLMRKKEGRKYKVSGKEKKELNKKRVEDKGKGGMWWPQ